MQRRFPLALLSAAVLIVTATGTARGGPAAPGELTSQNLTVNGVGSPRYRIPALTTSVKGTLLAAYDARPTLGDLPGNIGVVLRRSTDGGVTWKAQQVVRKDAAPQGHGDPSLLVDRTTGRIFVFYASSVNHGFPGSGTGNDESDPDILQADYGYSDDDGVTWTHRRLTKQLKDPAWSGMFAASGEGIQLRHGPHKGRLIQQYAIRISGANYAASAFSDDHGATWTMGSPVGPGGDENKTVELSDGRIMLNNRSKPYRTIAYSTDGGVNYTPFEQDKRLTDPANNASVMRYDAEAPASHPRSSWLLFSNTENATARRDLTVKMSCDNGRTWPIRKVVAPGGAAYSTLTKLPDGRVGLLYERGDYDHISYASFDLDWLGGTCADITIAPPAALKAGRNGKVEVRVVNRMEALRARGTLDLTVPGGWTTRQVSVPALDPDGTASALGIAAAGVIDPLRRRAGPRSASRLRHGSGAGTGRPDVRGHGDRGAPRGLRRPGPAEPPHGSGGGKGSPGGDVRTEDVRTEGDGAAGGRARARTRRHRSQVNRGQITRKGSAVPASGVTPSFRTASARSMKRSDSASPTARSVLAVLRVRCPHHVAPCPYSAGLDLRYGPSPEQDIRPSKIAVYISPRGNPVARNRRPADSGRRVIRRAVTLSVAGHSADDAPRPSSGPSGAAAQPVHRRDVRTTVILGRSSHPMGDPAVHPASPAEPASDAELQALARYWRAANYLSVGQIYLMDNALLRRPLAVEDIKPRLLGHFGTSPGLNLVHVHLNRVIKARNLDTVCIWGPGHGGPAVLANSWLDGTYTETYPDVTRDEEGMTRLFRQFSFPGGVPSHVAPETPGSIHEGGELGYSLSHAYGAAFDNPDLLSVCVIGDGESETGPLAASWHSNTFLDPVHDGAVLPILHLNGYKIANPTIPARLPEGQLDDLMRGYGYEPVHVTGDDPMTVHRDFAAALDRCLDRIAQIQREARADKDAERANDAPAPRWPMIVLRTPKGWTGPKTVDGKPVEGTWRAHQVPLSNVRESAEHRRQLEEWLRSYRPEELFDTRGRPAAELVDTAPRGTLRLGANPHANGGLLLRSLPLKPLEEFAVDVDKPGATMNEPTRVLGGYLRQVMADTAERRDFRLVGPDETASNRLDEVYGASGKAWQEEIHDVDENLTRHGRVMEILSEHTCQGWLEGYLLTGRHGLFSCYEAFVHIVDSMVNQHIKWLRTTRELPWRAPIASLNYLLTSHVWRQDHNGFSHQDPGFIGHVLNKSPEAVRVYLPPDTNTLLSTAEHCLASRDYVNVIVAGKQPGYDWLSLDDARAHCARGAGVWTWAGTEAPDQEPDVVLACAGDVPTLEVLAAASLLRSHLPELAVRVVNVVDIARLMPEGEHPHGMPDAEFDALFTRDKPVIFGFHGYPWLVHRLAYRRAVHPHLHVRGYKERGTTTTPFDMVVANDLDRFRLVMDVVDRVPGLGVRAVEVRQRMQDARLRHHAYVRTHGVDLPEVRDWSWQD